MKLLINVEGRPGELEFSRLESAYQFTYRCEGGVEAPAEASVIQVEPGIYSVLLEGRSYEVKIVEAETGYYVDLGGRRALVEVRDPRSLTRGGRAGAGEGRQTITAPMPGKVVRVLVKEGDPVEAGAGLVVVEAMKMQNEIKAPKTGTVVQLKAEPGATVKQGEILAVVE